MKCPSEKRLTAASLGADPRAAVHAETCERCSAELAAMVELRAFARRAPVRVASAERRDRIAALVMASSDAAEPVRRSQVPIVAVALVGFAAIAALVIWRAQPAPAVSAVAWPVLPVAPQVARAASPAVHPTAPTTAPATATATAHVTAPVPPGDVTSPSAPSRAASSTTRVFAGSQQRARDGELARDQVALEPHAIIARVIEPTAFEVGWTALRESRYADAIAAFDRATEPAVAEDAAYWAAIASARAGDRSDAARRLRTFLKSFPGSLRLAEARALLARLAP